MNKNENSLEDQIINFLSSCLRQEVDINNIESHPIRVLEAVKSIIGLNLDNPSMVLLNYIRRKDISGNLLEFKSDIKNNIETVSIYQLEEAINNNDLIKSEKLITQLLKLSDGRHILEYLLELSLKQRGKSLSVIWPIYKALKFIGYSSPEDVRNSLLIATQCLVYDEYYNLESKDIEPIDSIFDRSSLNDYALQLFGVVYEISNERFVRECYIDSSLESFIKYFASNLIEKTASINQSNFSINRREDLLQILENSKMDDRNILNVNALRAYMKNCSSLNKTKLAHYILSIEERT